MLNNLRVVITGAAGSLGQAAAARARQCGAHVIGLDIVDAATMANTDEYLKLDLLDRQATLDCFASLGRVDALMNIAGGFAMGDHAFDPSSRQWDTMFRLNVDTMRNATMGAVPLLLAGGGGAIVNIGALGALSGQAAMSAYCCAKSSVLPSIIDTAQNRKDMPDADFSRWVSPAQLAEVICFLASPAAGGIHGALIPVRGLV
jgi:NAD(P)-dependent dehydrogenase (short-subunit alcohol dehydrogenase family)